jgi:N-acetylglucosamine kinase-like BadF-type ATPase
MNYKNQKYVIGIDGGGIKTTAALANLERKILVRAKTGPSNIQKIGFKLTIENIVKVLNQVSKKYPKDKIVFIYIGLAGGLERDKEKKEEIKKELLKNPELSWISSKNILIEDDQLTAFRSGTNNKEGILIIAGTGSIIVGWSKNKKIIIGGRDYLIGDEGSGFWIGEKALRAVCSFIDGLSSETLLQKAIFKKLKIKTESDLLKKIYQLKTVETIASLSSVVDRATEKKDKIAKSILLQAGQELAVRANLLIQKLNFKNKKFPLVLVGSVFKSKIVLTQTKKIIKKFAPYVSFIRPKKDPIIGAIKLAISYKK